MLIPKLRFVDVLCWRDRVNANTTANGATSGSVARVGEQLITARGQPSNSDAAKSEYHTHVLERSPNICAPAATLNISTRAPPLSTTKLVLNQVHYNRFC
jgi:hypothetical protein